MIRGGSSCGSVTAEGWRRKRQRVSGIDSSGNGLTTVAVAVVAGAGGSGSGSTTVASSGRDYEICIGKLRCLCLPRRAGCAAPSSAVTHAHTPGPSSGNTTSQYPCSTVARAHRLLPFLPLQQGDPQVHRPRPDRLQPDPARCPQEGLPPTQVQASGLPHQE